MKTDDQSDQHRHRVPGYRHRLLPVAMHKFTKPAAYLILLLLAYALGYASHSQPHPYASSTKYFSSSSQAELDLANLTLFSKQCGDPLPPNRHRQQVLNKVFNGTSPWKNFPPKRVEKLLFPDWKKGWGSNGPVFENLIRRVRPRTIIEVGTFMGASATHMDGLAKQLGLQTQIVCVDDFRGWPGYYDEEKSLKMVNGDSLLLYQFMLNVLNSNATETIVFMPFSAGTALGVLCEWGVVGDLVEVDAAHDFHSAWSDINRAYKVLRPGGIIFGHDYFLKEDDYGVRRAVHLFARLKGFQIQIDGEHWVIDSAA